MAVPQLLALISVFLVASIISVITGSTSLITVPVMLQFGVEPRTALATNMFALTLMSLGGTLPFIGKGVIGSHRLPFLIFLTLAGSLLGALLVLIVPLKSVSIIISISMIGVAAFSILNRDLGLFVSINLPSRILDFLAYTATFLLSIYGGFFSGGYVTMLTAAYVILFRMTFIQAIATTKLINVFSSLVATIVFMCNGIVDYKLGVILGLTMFLGGIIGGSLALRLSNTWLQRIYLTAVAILALITLRKSQQQKSPN